MRFKISSIIECTTWLLKKYNELQQVQEKNIYRLVEIKQSSFGQHKLTIQVIGKSAIIECSPQEIVAVDPILEGFSKKDIRTITYLACDQFKRPRYKIVMQEFCEKINKMMFKLKETENGGTLKKTANQIIMDKDLINNLSNEDLNSISYIAGYECLQNENLLLKTNIEKKLSL